MAVSHPEQCQRARKNDPRLAFSPTGSECRWHCSRAPMGSNVRVGGVDEPARSTDVFYGLSHSLSILAVCSFSPVKDSGMRIAESARGPTIAICGRKKSVIVADTRGKVNALESRRQTYTMRKNTAFSIIFFFFSFLSHVAFCQVIVKRSQYFIKHKISLDNKRRFSHGNVMCFRFSWKMEKMHIFNFWNNRCKKRDDSCGSSVRSMKRQK